MKRLLAAAAVALCVSSAAQAQAPSPLNLIIFPAGLTGPCSSLRKGFFENEHLAVKVTETPGSVFQVKGIMAGDFDMAMTPFDNVVAYQEGQGETTSTLRPTCSPSWAGFEHAAPDRASGDRVVCGFEGQDARRRRPQHGYSLLMYRLLDHNNLPTGSYRLERLGGTASRVKALTEGKIAGTMVSSPQEILPEQNSFKRLGDLQPMLADTKPCQASRGDPGPRRIQSR